MLKKSMIVLVFLVMVAQALAIYGGESVTLYDEDCEFITVDIAGISEVDEGEFSLSDNCEIVDGVYNCSCDVPTVMTTKPNAVNNYTIEIGIWKMMEEQQSSGSSGSGSSGGSARKEIRNVENIEKVIENTESPSTQSNQEVVLGNTEGSSEQPLAEDENEEPVIEEENKANPLTGFTAVVLGENNRNVKIGGTVMVVVAIALVGNYLIRKKRIMKYFKK